MSAPHCVSLDLQSWKYFFQAQQGYISGKTPISLVEFYRETGLFYPLEKTVSPVRGSSVLFFVILQLMRVVFGGIRPLMLERSFVRIQMEGIEFGTLDVHKIIICRGILTERNNFWH